MKYFHLVWRNLLRRKTRTFFTFLCVLISFVLFGFLSIVRTAFTLDIDFAGADRVWVMNKVNIIVPLPAKYLEEIQAMDGVVLATHATWFGGSYQGNPNQFMVAPTNIANYLKLYPEFIVSPEEIKAATADRQGAIVGVGTANRYGWKIGDRVPMVPDLYQAKDGGAWNFNIRGIYHTNGKADESQFFFNYDYFDENRTPDMKGQVSWYVVKVADPSRSAQIAKAIDTKFENSSAETKTAPESAMIAEFAQQTGNIGAMLEAILTVVLFNIFLVVVNTMAQAVRERTSDLAVLKTLGFPDGTVLWLVIAESMVISVIAGSLGLFSTWFFLDYLKLFSSAMLPVFMLSRNAMLLGVGLFIGLGLFAGLFPALSASRLKLTDALRRT
jgi:putative ABC transport system permease protein